MPDNRGIRNLSHAQRAPSQKDGFVAYFGPIG